MDSNGINNFKGVMLCSRPNENPGPVKKDIFCGRVIPPEQLGLVPTKKYDEIKVRKRKNPILSKHKKWLEEFKAKITASKEQQEQAFIKEQQRQTKIRQQAQKERERVRMGGSLNNDSSNYDNQAPAKQQAEPRKEVVQPPTKKHKPKGNQKPAWAQTQQQVDRKEEKEADDLLNFFTNTDIEKYIDEVEVNALLSSLKHKIQDIKKETDWKENNRRRLKEQAKQYQQKKPDDQQDKKTEVSRGSVAKSVTSEKTARNTNHNLDRIDDLKSKLEKKKQGADEWDARTHTSKNSFANIEQRIAKNVADDLLRNYGNLKAVHSNVSVRKLLQREAARQLAETIAEKDPPSK